jgi:hypothetical protein
MVSVIMLSVVMLSVVMLNVVMLSVIMLSVIMLSVIKLIVIMLSVIVLSVVKLSTTFYSYAEYHILITILSVAIPSIVMLRREWARFCLGLVMPRNALFTNGNFSFLYFTSFSLPEPVAGFKPSFKG